jgi:hypothetical protein
MISEIWFHRSTENEPAITLFHKLPDGGEIADVFLITEELYNTWVPDVVR